MDAMTDHPQVVREGHTDAEHMALLLHSHRSAIGYGRTSQEVVARNLPPLERYHYGLMKYMLDYAEGVRSVHSDDPEIVMSAQVIVNAVTAFTTKATQLHQEVDR